MALNHILYRPQVLQRRLPPASERLPEEALEMASRLLADGIKGGRALEKAKEGLQEALDSIIPTLAANIGTAAQSMKTLIDPVKQAFQSLGAEFAAVNTPAEGLHAMARLLLLLADTLENLSADQIEALLNRILRIITDDLGFSRARMTDFINDLIDRVVQKMKEDFIMGDQSEQAHNEYLIGAYLEKLKRIAEEQIAEIELELSIPKLASKLVNFLRGLDWDRIRLAAAKVLEDVGNTAESLAILFDIFSGKFTVTVEVTVETSSQPGGGGGGLDPVSWYATYFERKFGWTWTDGVQSRETYHEEAPWDSRMAFRDSNLSPVVMEQLAHWSDVTMSVIEAILGYRSIQKKDIAGNVTHSTLKVINGVITTLLGFDNDEDWVTFYKVYSNWYVELLGKIVVSMLTGLESSHSCKGDGQGIFWLTLVGKDLAESLLYDNWTSRARQGLLSLLTLINSDPVNKPNSENHHQVVGYTMLISELFSWILASFSGRKNFGFPAHGSGAFFWVSWFVGAPVSGVLSAVAGVLTGWAISHSQQPEGTSGDATKPNDEAWGLAIGESVVASLFKHTVYNYLIWSGDTDGGKFGKDNTWPNPNYKTMKGYGPKATSPYLLPYKAGDVRQCAQGNLGPWSHNSNTNQIYAFDWDHDQGFEVLCVREGTVGNWHDIMPDHTTLLDNNLSIIHNLTPPIPEHDRDWTPDPVVTTAQYIHGAHFGVRHIFFAMGVPLERITGTPVHQGMLVMFSGDTGMSFYNHLHMHVSSPNSRSIPWVFRDADAPEDGVLKDLTWYKSDNTRAANLDGITVAHPPEHQSLQLWFNVDVVSTTATKTELDFSTANRNHGGIARSDIEGMFVNCTLVWEPANGPVQRRKILESKENASGNIDVKLATAWAPTPAAGQKLEIHTLTGTSTANTIVLDAYARSNKDVYTGRSIHVWWEDEDGYTIHQYKTISAYSHGERKVTIDGNWDRQPPEFSNFEIGGKTYQDSNDFYRRFAFIPGGGAPAAPARNSMNMARNHAGYNGTVSGTPGANTVVFSAVGAPPAANVADRFITIFDKPSWDGTRRVLAYQKAASYVAGTRTATMTAPWGVTFPAGTLYYKIGSVDYSVATDEQRAAGAFICPDSGAGYTPSNFTTGAAGVPYNSVTYKTW